MAETLRADKRVVLVLDGGGTTFRFNAIRDGRALLEAPRTMPSFGDDLERSLTQITDRFAFLVAGGLQSPVAVATTLNGTCEPAAQSGILTVVV